MKETTELMTAIGVIFFIILIFVSYYAGVKAGKKYGSGSNKERERDDE